MGTINITNEPHELIINGTTILMQADPTAGKEWGVLLETKWAQNTKAQRAKAIHDVTEALAALAQTPEDADTLRSLGLGLPTLLAASRGYVREVTGFPTQQLPGSKKN